MIARVAFHVAAALTLAVWAMVAAFVYLGQRSRP